jgi:hypothetical protein
MSIRGGDSHRKTASIKEGRPGHSRATDCIEGSASHSSHTDVQSIAKLDSAAALLVSAAAAWALVSPAPTQSSITARSRAGSLPRIGSAAAICRSASTRAATVSAGSVTTSGCPAPPRGEERRGRHLFGQ